MTATARSARWRSIPAARRSCWKNADITAGFDEGGNLAELVGVTDFPVILGGTDGVALNATVDAPVRATVRMMSGAEINADETFNVQLIPENDYFVFYVGGSLTLNLTNARDPSDDRVMPLEPPFGSEWLFISDVNDPMYYYYAHVPLVPLVPAVGEGFSYHGWLPFEPSLDYEELDSFNGTELKEGTLSLGIKLVDVFEFNGLRVLKKSTLKDIDWTDPFNSPFEFKAGLNGDSNIIWSVIGIGFFRMDFSEISATLDVGFDRQHMAMMQRIAPDVSWQPDWFHITPTTEAIGKWSIDGDGTAEIGISAGFDSRIPESNLSGELFLSTDTASFRGATTIGDTPLAVSLSFMNETTTGAVEFPESFGESITDDVSAAVDRRIGDVEATIAEYEDALTQFGELEINLDNIRTSIVVSTLTAIGRLPLVPSQVYQFVYTTVSTELNNACETRFTITRCASDYVDVDDVATRAANGARDIASDNILRYSAALQDLSAAAQEATDEELRQALRQALLTAYDLRSFVQRVTFSQDVRIVISTIVAGDIVINRTVSFDRDFRIELLTPTQAQLLLTAVDNIDQLTATGGIVIDLELLVDQLPTREILDTIREEVTSGVRAVPIPEGLGYTAAGNNYSAFVTIDGEDRPVEFNVLRPSDVREGVSDLLLDLLLP